MKRLRLILWGLVIAIADELEPPICDAKNEVLAKQHNVENCPCGFEYCELLEGHRFKHDNGHGVLWD